MAKKGIFDMMKSTFSVFALTTLLSSTFALAASSMPSVTAQTLNQNPTRYVGQQITLSGKIDRSLGNGAYIVSDSNAVNAADDTHHIMVFTSNMSNTKTRQQSGVMAPALKQGDMIQLTGKVEQFNVSNEVDTFSPKSDSETISEDNAAFPIIVTQPGKLQLQSSR